MKTDRGVARPRRDRETGLRPGLALIMLVALVPAFAGAQEEPAELSWTGGVSDVPLVELEGVWVFLPRESDPMVEEWAGREVIYEIQQYPDRIVLDFRPEEGQRNLQGYRWDGSLSEFERGGAEVRERARWVDGGRALEIEGRWWIPEEPEDVTAYTFRYSLDGPDELVFVQSSDTGQTVWRFRRR